MHLLIFICTSGVMYCLLLQLVCMIRTFLVLEEDLLGEEALL